MLIKEYNFSLKLKYEGVKNNTRANIHCTLIHDITRPPKGGHRISLFSSRTNCAADQKVLTIALSTGDIHLLTTIMATSTQ